MLSILLHRHNGAHSICDVLAAAMRHYPCMHVIGYDIPPRLAFHCRATGSCVACLCLHILFFFNHFHLRTQRACNLVEHINIHGILAGFHATDVRGGDACNLSKLLLLPALGATHLADALAHSLALVINDLIFFHVVYMT